MEPYPPVPESPPMGTIHAQAQGEGPPVAQMKFHIIQGVDLVRYKRKMRRVTPRKRKRRVAGDRLIIQRQRSPFSPCGSLSRDTLDVEYAVANHDEWRAMSKFNSFVLGSTKYLCQGFVTVANESSVRGTNLAPREWVARLLEIRATNSHHVFARVFWMYSPDDLPEKGRNFTGGRQPYHGAEELLASNHMDIINVNTVNSQADVQQWIEDEHEEIQDGLYWRQAYDIRTAEISAAAPVCNCLKPENPDKTLVNCSACGIWLHDECIVDNVLMRTYRRLGRSKPQTSVGVTPVEDDTECEPTSGDTCELSAGNAEEIAEDTITVATNKPSGSRALTPQDTPSPVRAARGKPWKSRPEKPYKGLFRGNLLTPTDQAPMVRINDQRQNVQGGLKCWKVTVDCLHCGKTLR